MNLQPGTVSGPTGQVATLRRGQRGEWTLAHNGRVRWGRQQEIVEDIVFFQLNGKLPDRHVGWF